MELSLLSAKLKLPLSGPSHHHRCPVKVDRWTAKLDGTTEVCWLPGWSEKL